mmetsp:Transcript_21720/g.44043  ORF Transcript_21720/g.44043 Transcript_21720/m.44043 type:complete len:156 (-) Transcript_21720:95-562(-)|eukprot:CAMPEP_0181315920 /NCGR_PEP_ID=MMETSP1101-20121128/15625_1 /TAXON_ID=46948 /ORGANISM="Rhodomonas abbreviata, Strain Caron Lab Isolate" /LENGTH=155 /DNA_ID=CAMNT_0023423145 /DNA_START=57 /DNA_END=524 /DNA_ORIENTATION=-
MSGRDVFQVGSGPAQQQEISAALDMDPSSLQGEGYRQMKKNMPRVSSLMALKQLTDSGHNSPMLSVKKDKKLLGSWDTGDNLQRIGSNDTNKSSKGVRVLPTECTPNEEVSKEELESVIRKMEDADLECWRTQSTDSTECDEARSSEIQNLIMSF